MSVPKNLNAENENIACCITSLRLPTRFSLLDVKRGMRAEKTAEEGFFLRIRARHKRVSLSERDGCNVNNEDLLSSAGWAADFRQSALRSADVRAAESDILTETSPIICTTETVWTEWRQMGIGDKKTANVYVYIWASISNLIFGQKQISDFTKKWCNSHPSIYPSLLNSC